MCEVTNTVISMVDLTSQKSIKYGWSYKYCHQYEHHKKVFSMCEITNTVISMVDLTSQKCI
jgi:hypothetical protein